MNTQPSNFIYSEYGEPLILDGDSDLADKISLLASQMNAGEYELLKLLAEFDRRKGWANRSKKRVGALVVIS